MGLKDIILLAVSLLGLGSIVYLMYSYAGRVKEAEDAPYNRGDAEAVNRGGDRNTGLRRRLRNPNGDNEEEDGDGGDDVDLANMSKKDIQKHEKRRAKAAARQAEEARREARKEKEEKRLEALREREHEKELEFQRKEEEAERVRLERERKLALEYNPWKDPVSLDDSSLGEKDLDLLCTRISEREVISVEELADEFNISTVLCLLLVQSLIDSRKVHSAIDGEGNILHLSKSTISTLAASVGEAGYITKEQLSEQASQILSPHVQIA